MKMQRLLTAFAASFVFLPIGAGAQVTRSANVSGDSLYKTIYTLDSVFFDAYNRCDVARIKAFFTEDLEFYHDQTGLSGRDSVMKDLQKYVCGKVRRDLVNGTFEVNLLKGYGAVSTGLHMFCDPRTYRVCEDKTSGIAKFVNLWRYKDGKWLMSRVISYDHVSSHQRGGT